jgi:hypothetical protein
VTLGPDSFARVVGAMVTSSGLSAAKLSVDAGLGSEVVGKVVTGRTGWPNSHTLFRLAAAAGWTRQRLADEIDRQRGSCRAASRAGARPGSCCRR